jgi:hypothetical protein
MFEEFTAGLSWIDWYALGVATVLVLQGATVLLWEYLKEQGLLARKEEKPNDDSRSL